MRITQIATSVGALCAKTNRPLALAAMGLLILAGQAAMAGSINAPHDFTGDSSTNWGWENQADPNTQLGGVNELTYTYGATNGVSYVSSTITDGSTVFPDGTGVVVANFTLDLNNYPTGTSDYGTTYIAQIACSTGNRGKIPASSPAIAYLGFGGYNYPGKYRFEQGVGIQYVGTSNVSPAATTGNHPAFDLVYDVTWTVEISGSDAAGWTVASDATFHGPVDSVGTIGDIVIPTVSYTRVDATFDGWASATAYKIGSNGYKGTGAAAGDSFTIDSFSAAAIPEPATLGLLALGGLMMLPRRR